MQEPAQGYQGSLIAYLATHSQPCPQAIFSRLITSASLYLIKGSKAKSKYVGLVILAQLPKLMLLYVADCIANRSETTVNDTTSCKQQY